MVDPAAAVEEHQVAGAHVLLRDAAGVAGLGPGRARHVEAGAGVAVVDQAGAVEAVRAGGTVGVGVAALAHGDVAGAEHAGGHPAGGGASRSSSCVGLRGRRGRRDGAGAAVGRGGGQRRQRRGGEAETGEGERAGAHRARGRRHEVGPFPRL